ncbi:hypothetical protein [Streptomyces sp. NPDC001978]|uniref:hypothetical protein n=1 Tax=Streptomyces sp. NPDC001978 TaxID=3364627 RepID=UPI00369D0E49
MEAEKCHRAHAVVEQVFADLEDSALGHLPSGKFTANAAWLTLTALAHNLTRALGALASAFHTKARTGIIRRQLIAVPTRLAAGARILTFHLPRLALAGRLRGAVDSRWLPPANLTPCHPASPRPRTSETPPPGRPPGDRPHPSVEIRPEIT